MRKTLIILFSVLLLGLLGFLTWHTYRTNIATPSQEIEDDNSDVYAEEDASPLYRDPEGRFSFTKPPGYMVRLIDEGDGETLLVQKVENASLSFQIFISSFDESGPITPERIQKDIPDMIINDPQQAVVGKRKLTVLIFKSTDPSIGETRELWLAHAGYLYQITAPIKLDAEVAEMMKTWESK